MKTFKLMLVFIVAASVGFLIFVRDKKDSVCFPDELSEIQNSGKHYKGRVIAYYKAPLESSFMLNEMLQWNAYYLNYYNTIDFCFIIAETDTTEFKLVMDQMGFLPPYQFDTNNSFAKKYNYQFIAFITDPYNQILAISNPSMGKEFENQIQAMIK